MIAASGGIAWGAEGWAPPALGLGAAALALVAWSYARRGAPAHVPARARALAAALKVAGLALLLACLVEPLVRRAHARPGANRLHVLVDDSASLGVRDAGAAAPRADAVRALLAEDAPWLARAAVDFDVRRHAFDRRLRRIDGAADLTFTGLASGLWNALERTAARSAGRPVAGIVVITDGLATDSAADLDALEALAGSLPPVFPVVVGRAPGRDLVLGPIEVTRTSFEASPVTLAAELASSGCAGEEVLVELLDEAGAVLERRTVRADDGAPVGVRFDAPPEATGLSFYRLRASLADPTRAEATERNNERGAVVDRGAGPYRVLYVAGKPSWELKFLQRAAAEDPELELVALVRIARRQPKFTFRAGEDRRNRLWDGFDGREEDVAEELDEPVLLRLGTRDELELRAGFPRAADELFAYHALVVDDLEAAFFTPDQQSLVEGFVARRGGGLLALGGGESFARGGYRRTPIEALLPLYLDGAAPDSPVAAAWRLELTRDGWLEPWVRLRSTEEAERERLAEMPAFHSLSRAGRPKPGAQVLALARGERGETEPALVAQRFGKGRSAAMLLGDLWRWDLRRPDPSTSDLGAAWRQVLRWLVADVPRRVELSARVEGEHVALRIALRDEVFDALHDAALDLEVQPPEGGAFPLEATPSRTEPGVWEATFAPRAPGPYRATLAARLPDGSELGADGAGVVWEPAATELARLAPDRERLAELARRTGGELVEPAGLESFVARLAAGEVPVTDERLDPLWHRWWVLVLALLCLCAEWAVRRLHGLP